MTSMMFRSGDRYKVLEIWFDYFSLDVHISVDGKEECLSIDLTKRLIKALKETVKEAGDA